MKKFLIFLTIVELLSCKKLMHDEDLTLSKITSYDQLVLAAGGVYGMLTNRAIRYDSNEKGDDINWASPYDLYYNRKCYPVSVTDIYYGTADWQALYLVIASANSILDQFNIASIIDVRTREVLGEMYFIRAYCHFRLTRVYGRIPIIKDANFSYNTPLASFEEIYQFIESDLKMAMEMLPKNNASARQPYITPHRGTAKAVLAEVYLAHAGYPIKDASKYTLAAKEAGETIDSANYFGFNILPDFANVWDSAHLYNAESVFSLYYHRVENLSDFYYSSKVYPYYISFSRNLTLANLPRANPFYVAPRNFPGTTYYSSEINFFNNYPEGYRKEITFYTTIYVYNIHYDPSGAVISADSGYVHIDKATPCNRVAIRKFFYYSYIVQFEHFSNYFVIFGIPRQYIFRFAQTELTYAEAMARSGQLNTKAYDCVNRIRRRAHHLDLEVPSAFDLPSGLSANAFADSVVWERAWELCAEPEGRWFDLIRLEMVEDLPKLRNLSEGGPPGLVFDKSVYFFPIPESDKVLNPNLRK